MKIDLILSITKINFWSHSFLALFLFAYQGQVSAQVNYIEPYFEADIGQVEPPNASFKPFVIPVHDGLLRVGNQDKYDVPLGNQDMQVHRTIPNRKEGLKQKNNGVLTYLGLVAFANNRHQISLDGLRDALLGGASIPQVRYKEGYAHWGVHTLYLARATLTDEEYRHYLCSDGLLCPLDKFKGERPFQATGFTVIPYWGGAKNDFKIRGAWREFVTSHGQTLIDWGNSLERRVAVVSHAKLSTYDFKRGGFDVNISLPIPLASESLAGLANHSGPAYDITFPALENKGSLKINVFLKLSAEKAEQLRNNFTVASRKYRWPLYAVYDGELRNIEVPQGPARLGDRLPLSYEHAIVGKKIQFFYGPALKEKAFEVVF